MTVARLIPLVRAFAGLVSGSIEVPVGPFAVFNLIGTVIWAAALSSIGYGVGSAWNRVSQYMSLGGYVLALFVIVPLVGLILLRLREFRKEKAAAEASAAADPAGPAGTGPTSGPATPRPRRPSRRADAVPAGQPPARLRPRAR